MRYTPDYYEIFHCTAGECPITCCPAVIDLWFSRETLTFPEPPASTASPLLEIRTQLIHLFQHSTGSIEMALLSGFYVLLELRRADTLTSELVRDYFSEETLSQLRSLIRDIELPWEDSLSECNELLLDLAVNYQKEALYLDYLTPILTLAETLSEKNEPEKLLGSWEQFQNTLMPYQTLLRHFLANEFFSELLEPGSGLDDMILQMQWIALEYVVVRHSLFLKWMQDGSGKLPYEAVRDYLVIITRMTGYDAADIREYLGDNFEELIWEWGYLGVIVNK